ncbi:MAG: hypothetical protein KatS3mg015_2744 [Fimbriimonadales bacterium]|nr:MAG: hypothetical protein KatS3mg015_2744 [Fimbriimonadales bacterium]
MNDLQCYKLASPSSDDEATLLTSFLLRGVWAYAHSEERYFRLVSRDAVWRALLRSDSLTIRKIKNRTERYNLWAITMQGGEAQPHDSFIGATAAVGALLPSLTHRALLELISYAAVRLAYVMRLQCECGIMLYTELRECQCGLLDPTVVEGSRRDKFCPECSEYIDSMYLDHLLRDFKP